MCIVKNKKTLRILVPDCGYFSSVLIIHVCLCVCASVCACENVKSDFYTKLQKLDSDVLEKMKDSLFADHASDNVTTAVWLTICLYLSR